MQLTFLGANRTVTGSKYLLQDADKNIMVDCGLFQGQKELRLRNWQPFPFRAADIDALILTHAHLDHTGAIPLLVKQGFRGKIYCTPATYSLCKIILPDSGSIHEEDAERANRLHYTKHAPALPLYTTKEAEESLQYFHPVGFGDKHFLSDETYFTYHRAGHILGAAMVHYHSGDGTSILFSGDIGRPSDPVIKPPAMIQQADYLVMESTYGNRTHASIDPVEELATIVSATIARGGTVLMPAFAIGRAQMIMYYIYRMKEKGLIPKNLPVFLDSPMAINASELLHRHENDHRLSRELCYQICDAVTYTKTKQQSMALNNNTMPKIIISASGMAVGGRVLHHLKNYLSDSRNSVILAGFQAAGTRGDRLARGEGEIKIHGQMWPVRAQIFKMDSMSAHADANEMMDWLRHFTEAPRKVFITHGEEEASIAFRDRITSELNWQAEIPDYLQSFTL